MNPTILSRCIDELKKDQPRIDYVLGMLEALVEAQPKPPTLGAGLYPDRVVQVSPPESGTPIRADETIDPLTAAYAGGPIAELHG